MEDIIRRLKIDQLKARLSLYRLERLCMSRELISLTTGEERREVIRLRKPELEIEEKGVKRDLE